jgi:hypothetical protein
VPRTSEEERRSQAGRTRAQNRDGRHLPGYTTAGSIAGSREVFGTMDFVLFRAVAGASRLDRRARYHRE